MLITQYHPLCDNCDHLIVNYVSEYMSKVLSSDSYVISCIY